MEGAFRLESRLLVKEASEPGSELLVEGASGPGSGLLIEKDPMLEP